MDISKPREERTDITAGELKEDVAHTFSKPLDALRRGLDNTVTGVESVTRRAADMRNEVNGLMALSYDARLDDAYSELRAACEYLAQAAGSLRSIREGMEA